MTEQVIAREVHSGVWQWSLIAGKDATSQSTVQDVHTGDSEALKASLPAANIPVGIALRGQQVVSTAVSLDSNQIKHAARLIPYELEDELSGSVDDLHFAFQGTANDEFAVIYTEQEHCANSIGELSEQGCDVYSALPDYLLLGLPENGVCLLLEDGMLRARLSEHWGFAVEAELAGMVLERIAEQSAFQGQPPECIRVVAENDLGIETVLACVPESWATLKRETFVGGFWDCMDRDSDLSALNLRSGRFARQLPVARWWQIWKRPVYFLAAAFAVAIAVNVGLYLSAKSQEKSVLTNINSVYLDAVPDGRLGDVEGILESKLKTLGSSDTGAPTNLVYLLSKVTEVVAQSENAKLTNFNYNGEQKSLQLTLEVSSLGNVGDIRSKLQTLGVETNSPRTTALGDGYQARMRVTEAN